MEEEKKITICLDKPMEHQGSLEIYYLQCLRYVQDEVKKFGVEIEYVSEYSLPGITCRTRPIYTGAVVYDDNYEELIKRLQEKLTQPY